MAASRLPLIDQDWVDRTRNALKDMGRVIYALVLRESRTRHGQSDLGYTWAIIDPLIQLLVLWAFFVAMGRRSPVDATFPVFLMTGIVPYNYWRNSMGRGASAISANLALLTYPQVKVTDLVLGRMLLETATLAVVYMVFIIGLHVTTGEPYSSWYDEPLNMCAAIFAMIYFSLGTSMFCCSMARLFPVWGNIISYIGRPLWLTSGVFFTLESLPNNARAYAVYNPVAHMIDWLRSATLPGYESAQYSPSYLLMWSTSFLLIGLLLDRLLDLIGHSETDS